MKYHLLKPEYAKFKLFTFLLIFVVALLSCKKEYIADPAAPGNVYVPKLAKILVDNAASYEYVYNDSNLIRQEKSKFDFTLHHYNAKGQLSYTEYYDNDAILSNDQSVSETAINNVAWVTMESGKKSSVISYLYNDNGQLIKTNTVRPGSECSEYSNFTYDANNRITRQTMYFENIVTGYIDYEYDAKGNMTSEKLYNTPADADPELITSTAYSFDSEPNPMRANSKLLIPGMNSNPNNITKETYTIYFTAEQGTNDVQITENAYKYNGLGYPVSRNGDVTYVYE